MKTNEFNEKEYLKVQLINKEQLPKINNYSKYFIYEAIIEEAGKYYCFRCGNNRLITYENIKYCPNCTEFTRVDNQKIFIQKTFSKINFEYEDKLKLLKLSPKQKLASKFIKSSNLNLKDCLIHAVCGAGKTEITFEIISEKLQKNEYVCFAIPRIDILYEVAERLKDYFPKTSIAILNSQEEKNVFAQIYVMTTNQILNFKKIFSLIIVDEVDAYPYEYNFKYEYGVQTAKKKDGTVVYLTSTPSKKFQNKKLPTYIINRRWHNFLLPVPIFKYFNLKTLKKGKVSSGNLKKLEKYNMLFDKKNKDSLNRNDMINKKQLLLFISNIEEGKIILEVLQKYIPIEFVYSQKANRKEIIEDFKNQKFNVLLTTTILERGVTFKNIDVAILDTSNELYTISSLIQIAGRVNRNIKYQNGKVYFFHNGITANMLKSKNMILKMNK